MMWRLLTRLWSEVTKVEEGQRAVGRGWRPLTRLWSGETRKQRGRKFAETGGWYSDSGVGEVSTAQ